MAEPGGLWASDSCAAWAAAAARYPAVIAAQGVNGLAALDTWYAEVLPKVLLARHPATITADELEQVTAWKMKRGVWRERNRLLVAGNAAGLVAATGAEAFAAVPDPRQPVAILSRLAGVGPATASAVLAAYAPAVYPFFDELVAAQIPDLGPVAFTPAYYARYADHLCARAIHLRESCPDPYWTAHTVGQALWAAAGGKAGVPV